MLAVIATAAGLYTLFYVRASSIQSSERLALRAAAFSAGLASSEIDTSIGQLAASTGGLASTPNIGDVVASPEDCSLTFNGVGVFPGGRLDLVTPEGEVACSSDTSIVTDGVSYSTDDWFERAHEDGQVLVPTTDPVSGASVLVQAVTTPSGVVVAGFLELASSDRPWRIASAVRVNSS